MVTSQRLVNVCGIDAYIRQLIQLHFNVRSEVSEDGSCGVVKGEGTISGRIGTHVSITSHMKVGCWVNCANTNRICRSIYVKGISVHCEVGADVGITHDV